MGFRVYRGLGFKVSGFRGLGFTEVLQGNGMRSFSGSGERGSFPYAKKLHQVEQGPDPHSYKKPYLVAVGQLDYRKPHDPLTPTPETLNPPNPSSACRKLLMISIELTPRSTAIESFTLGCTIGPTQATEVKVSFRRACQA